MRDNFIKEFYDDDDVWLTSYLYYISAQPISLAINHWSTSAQCVSLDAFALFHCCFNQCCAVYVGWSTGVTFLDIRHFIAKIGYENTRSLELFKKLGFIEVIHFMSIL